jgi:hypothetical protein
MLALAVSTGAWAQPVNAASTRSSTTATAPPSGIAFDWKQQEASSRLRDFLDADPQANGGLSSTSPRDVTVHLLAGHIPPAGYSTEVELARAAGVSVSVDYVSRSQATLGQLAKKACHGPQFRFTVVTYCAIDFDSNDLRIGVPDPSKIDHASVTADYGSGLVNVVHGEQFVNAGRESDWPPPFYGGDDIAVTKGGCTAGFTMTDRYGNDYMITAGHCFGVNATGATVYTEPVYNTFGVEYFTLYTSACWPPGTNSCFDAAIIGGQGQSNVSYAGRAWIGGLGTTTSQAVAGAVAVNVGTPMYFAGSRSGQVLVRVTSGPYCGFDDPDFVWTCGLQQVQAVNAGQNACKGGDSGGPVYGPTGTGKIIAVGIIKACNGSGGGVFVGINSILGAYASKIKLG